MAYLEKPSVTPEASATPSSSSALRPASTLISAKSVNYSKQRPDGKVELKDTDVWDKLGYTWPWWKKWGILSVIFAVQVSMNLNASLYANAVPLLSDHFHISNQAARVGQMIFLCSYAFGCELWAPWSEEFGRWPILQLSLFFVNIWQIPCALAPNFGTIVVCRFLGGISSAGGSVTLGMVADMWEEHNQQYAVAFIVLSSVGGSAVGPIFGGFVQKFLDWRWNFWIQLIAGGTVQALHFFVPETRATVLVTREAKRRRKAGETMLYSTTELEGSQLNVRHVLMTWARPFEMFLREPIVLWLSLLSGFSDALIFTFLESYTPVFKQWGFDEATTGLAFIPIMVGYFIAWFSFFPFIRRDIKIRERDPEALPPEARLYWLLWTAPLEPIGLFGFAWTSLGPPIPWIAPLLFSSLIGIANYAIYMATIDYMVASYGPYSASATGGNGFARDFLAGIAAMYATPMYSNIPGRPLEYATTILACIGVLVVIPVYIFYWNGPKIRAKSKFAMTLASERKEHRHRVQTVGEKAQADHIERIEENKE
ncbi:major facilitator superfamily domain-containing protein [Vararia minispora EC-137]|uniref:Major facilitator superfamily domain-containing protein n=1 Tax=Vararia minispora EC-137 TaxID=1314806 RepID=A0ACB8QQ79_9AGAM|nr:major facilitator superfamily domain-containing protein [Vararia minispora EC-137]